MKKAYDLEVAYYPDGSPAPPVDNFKEFAPEEIDMSTCRFKIWCEGSLFLLKYLRNGTNTFVRRLAPPETRNERSTLCWNPDT
jgi:hypothetical protein